MCGEHFIHGLRASRKYQQVHSIVEIATGVVGRQGNGREVCNDSYRDLFLILFFVYVAVRENIKFYEQGTVLIHDIKVDGEVCALLILFMESSHSKCQFRINEFVTEIMDEGIQIKSLQDYLYSKCNSKCTIEV